MMNRETTGRTAGNGVMAPNLFVRGPGLMVELRAFFSQQNLVKKPLRVAMEDFCDLRAQIWIRLAKSVNNLAQMGFVDSDHLGKAVLPDAARIHAQLQIWVDVTIDWHLFTQRLS
jgi:hypothetical protein